MDSLSYGDSAIHRLDPRAKLLVTLVFIAAVVSVPKYALARLMPFFLFPVVMASLANLPVGFLLGRLAIVSPFALLIGIFNPLLDREVLLQLGPLAVTGGWISFASVMVRFVLTIGAALILIATTSFPGICHALERLRVPKAFVVQLMFLYRFVFVLTEEALRIIRARRLRSFGTRSPELKQFVQIVGVLFLRAVDRAERVYWAMGNRGFDGKIRTLRRLRFRARDGIFLTVCVVVLVLLRFGDVNGFFGSLALGVFR